MMRLSFLGRGFFFLSSLGVCFSLSLSLHSEDSQKTKQKEEESSTVSFERAKEMAEYENYLMEKQAEQDRFRGMSKTQQLLMQLREGADAPKNKKEQNKEKEIPKQQFLKEKIKEQKEDEKKEGEREIQRDEEEELKALEEKKKKLKEPPPQSDPSKQAVDEKKKSSFYKNLLVVDYRSGEETKLLNYKKTDKSLHSESKVDKKQNVKDPLEEVDFIREVTLSPYALENEFSRDEF